MMGYWYGSMVGGFGFFEAITFIVILVDLVLLGIWLWQHISKQ